MTPTHAISADEARRLLAEDRESRESKRQPLVCSDCEMVAEAAPWMAAGARHLGCSGRWTEP